MEVPIVAFLTVPSSGEPSGKSAFNVHRSVDPAAAVSPAMQQVTSRRLAYLLLAKPYVHGLFWNQLCDADNGDFAYGGLFDDQHRPKPVWDEFTSMRQRYL
jgi:hypothetical protein